MHGGTEPVELKSRETDRVVGGTGFSARLGVDRLGRALSLNASTFRSHLPLAVLGLASELVYLLYFLRQFPLATYYHHDLTIGDITAYSHAEFFAFVGFVSLLFLLLGLACRCAWNTDDLPSLWLIIGFGTVFALTLTFVYPITSTDMFSYLNQSKILVHYHQNPLVTSPAAFPGDPTMNRAPVWRAFPAPYGPLGVLVDALPTFVTGGNVFASLILLKLIFSGMALGCAAVVYRILGQIQPRFALLGTLLVAWNPLILVETSVNGHNDIAMMLLVLCALLAMAVERPTLASGLLAISAMVKYISLVLLPLFLVYGLWHQPSPRARVTYIIQTVGLILAIIVVLYAPFWHGTGTFHNLTLQINRYADSLASLLIDLFPRGITAGVAALIGWTVFVASYNYALWLSSGTLPEFLRACFVALLTFIAFALTNVQVWYLEWAVLVAVTLPVAAEYVSAALVSYGAALSSASWTFVAVWLRADKHPTNAALVDGISYLITFAPAIAAYVALMTWKPKLAEKDGSSSGT